MINRMLIIGSLETHGMLLYIYAWLTKNVQLTPASFTEVFSTYFLLSYVKVVNTSLDLLMPCSAGCGLSLIHI